MFFVAIFSAAFLQLAQAQYLDAKVGQNAIKLAQKIQNEDLIFDETAFSTKITSLETTNSERLSLLRNEFTRVVWSAEKSKLSQISRDYVRIAALTKNERDIKFGQLLTTFTSHYEDDFTDETFASTRLAMEAYLETGDWFVRHGAHNLSSLSYPASADFTLALETAQKGLKLIPEQHSKYSEEAKINSISSLAYLHIILLNVKHSVTSYDELIQLQQTNNQPVDGMSIINNLIYSFSSWRDRSTTKELLDILLLLESEHPSNVPGLTEIRASQTYAKLGQYETALTHARDALNRSEIESLRESAHFAHITALAGLGRTNEARNALKTLKDSYSETEWTKLQSSEKLLEIEALLSASDGDMKTAIKLMEMKLDKNVQEIMSINNSQTANKLAALQNSKERREERAVAFQREAELKEIALNRQKRVSQLLTVLVIFLGVIAVAVSAFARYRSKVATKMELAAKKAMAGEKSKAEFLAVMSHELRTPLNGILGMADILDRKAETPGDKEKTGIIVDCGQELLELVESIFDMTLIESGDIHLYAERVNIPKLLSKLIKKWGSEIEAKGIAFTAHIDASVPEYMEVDAKRLTTAIAALLSNANKFTTKGRVHLHVVSQSSHLSGLTELKVIIADTGVGISEEAQSRLFQPFVQADSSMTRHYGGAGLGLSISKGLVALMDGNISVNSREHRGSEFTLTINAPALESPQAKLQSGKVVQCVDQNIRASSTVAPVAAQASSRILIAEDDRACQKVLKSLLEPMGAKLIFTFNGQEALDALSLNHFDLIITDIRMPGMDGVTAVRRIRQSRSDHSDIPIIALTADLANETSARCKAAGVDAFLTKPIKAAELYAAMAFVREKCVQSQQSLAS